MAIDLIAQGRFQRTAPVKAFCKLSVLPRSDFTHYLCERRNQPNKTKERSNYESKTNRSQIQTCPWTSRTVMQPSSVVGSTYSDLFRCVRAEHVCVGNRYARRRDLQIQLGWKAKHLCFGIKLPRRSGG